jgi:hypothetical protein
MPKPESVGLALSLLGYGLMVCGGGCTHLLGLHPRVVVHVVNLDVLVCAEVLDDGISGTVDSGVLGRHRRAFEGCVDG